MNLSEKLERLFFLGYLCGSRSCCLEDLLGEDKESLAEKESVIKELVDAEGIRKFYQNEGFNR